MVERGDSSSAGVFDAVRHTLRASGGPLSGDSPPTDRAGTRFEGVREERYQLGGVLGEGAEGRTYAARDGLLGREVAIKVLSEADGGDATTRGLREARALSQLDHPSIVPVHDLVMSPDGRAQLVMKRVRGRPLTEVLSHIRERPPSPAVLFDITTILVRLCEALAHAHALGVLHLDIKPSNIMVGGYGEVHLMNWGASFSPDSPPGPGVRMLGTPGFMSPEQLWEDPGQVDPRADVFGLGAVLYFALEGEAPADLRDWRLPSHLGALERLVREALDPDRERRIASVDTLRHRLLQFQRGEAPARPRVYPAGAWILREGEPGHEAFLIDQGRCEALRERDGMEHVLRVMNPGEIFGELALFEDGRRTASVRALDEVRVQVLDHHSVMSELANAQPWLRPLVEGLAQRLRSTEQEPEDDLV